MKHTTIILALVVALATSQTWLVGAFTLQSRGQMVVKTKKGAELDLYEASYALVIGESRYTNGWNELPGVRQDVPAVKAALERQGFTVETLEDLTGDKLTAGIRAFIARWGLSKRNRLVFYFAGHGHTINDDGNEMGYFVPVDAPLPNRDESGFIQTALPMSQIETYAQQIKAVHALFIFDSCFSGSLFEALNRSTPDDIAEKTAQPVRQFITAGTAQQTVPDQSIFRKQFVSGVAGEADYDRDGYVTGTELGMFLDKTVTNYSKRAQTPRYGKIRNPNLDKGDLVFGFGSVSQPGTFGGVSLEAKELAFWDSIKNSSDVEDFREYLRKYPEGEFAGLARNRIAKLTPAPPKPALTPGPGMALSPDQVSVDLMNLANQIRGKVEAAERNNPDEPPFMNGNPEYLRFRFDNDQLESYVTYHERQLVIYPIDAYRAVFKEKERAEFDKQMNALKQLLIRQPVSPVEEITVFPAAEAAQVFHAQVKYLSFNGGKGVRFISRYAQDVTPTTNDSIFYTFQGLSSDGKYYIALFYPIDARGLPETDIIKRTVRFLERLQPADYDPDLTRLDDMVKSLRVGK